MRSPSRWFARRPKPSTPVLPTLALHELPREPASPPPEYESKPDPNLHIEDTKASAAYIPGTGVAAPGSKDGAAAGALPVEYLDDDNTNVIILLKEDYLSAKAYMRELDYKDAAKHLIRRTLWKWYAIIGVIIVFSVLVTVKHDEIIHYLHPIIKTIRSWPAGWMIPLAALIIVSYPPLVGHEIIGILIGLVWGLGQGFAILAAGTFLGEIALWFSFKTCCQGRAAKFEKKNKLYSSLTQLIREKTFMFVLILRFSAVPGHITTAVSASANANFWSYLLAAFLTLPKQLTIVYLGQAFGEKSRTNTIISITTTVLTLFATVVAACYIYYQMRLLMRRNARIRPLAVVPVHGPGGAAPSWGDVAEFAAAAAAANRRHSTGGVIVITAPAYGADPMSSTTALTRSSADEISPVDVDNALATHVPAHHFPKHLRAQLRGWSVPHHMTPDEMREFAEEMHDAAVPVHASAPAPAASSQPRFGTSFTNANRPSRPVPPGFSPTRDLPAVRAPPPPFELDPRDASPSYPPTSGVAPRRPHLADQRGESSVGLLSRRPGHDGADSGNMV